MRVLVAEDDPISNQILVNTLTDWGYEVIFAQDGNQAWQHLQEDEAPKLVILDWMMPGLSGLEICRRLRMQNHDSYTYILLLTGKTEKGDIVEGLAAGADDYIAKPFDPQELKVRIYSGERILNLEGELRKTLSKLRESEKLRANFISALTHDLRTPLAAEKRALELIEIYKEENCSKTNLLVHSLLKNNDDLLKLVNQLLESYQAEEVKIALVPEPFDLNQLVSDCFLSVAALAGTQKIQLINRVPNTAVPLIGDPYQLKRVLNNLIGNALNYIPDGSQVEVTLTEQDDFWEVQVRDSGQGIHPDILPHLFERYYAGNNRALKIGSGLGLSICKSIVELHGGEIGVESTLGQGTCFYFTLPKEVPPKVTESPLTLLIVEDQELAGISLKLSLEATGSVEVVGIAENGFEAISLASEQKPDIILMDIVMPKMDGITATQRIKAACPETKIIMLTSQTNQQEVFAALAASADGYCLKDIKTHRLIDVIQSVMKADTPLPTQ